MKNWIGIGVLLLASPAWAQVKGPAIARDQPIEISSDALDVYQEQHQAIFTGHVIATQGTTNLKAEKMTVHYRQDNAKDAGGTAAQGISKIVAEGDVLFTTPTETAQGNVAVYNADTDTIDLTGAVTLTREQNVLKGERLNYNLTTGRSVLTAGGSRVTGTTGASPTGGRVRALIVPKSDKK